MRCGKGEQTRLIARKRGFRKNGIALPTLRDCKQLPDEQINTRRTVGGKEQGMSTQGQIKRLQRKLRREWLMSLTPDKRVIEDERIHSRLVLLAERRANFAKSLPSSHSDHYFDAQIEIGGVIMDNVSDDDTLYLAVCKWVGKFRKLGLFHSELTTIMDG